MHRPARRIPLLAAAIVGSLPAVAAADLFVYQGPADGTGVWNSAVKPYYAWVSSSTAFNTDRPGNGDIGFIGRYYVSGTQHGVTNTTVQYNDNYSAPGLSQVVLDAGNTLVQPAGTTMYLFDGLVGQSGLGVYQMTGGSATFNSLQVGVVGGRNGVFMLGGSGSVFTTPGGEERIGVEGVGSFGQSGGTNSPDTLEIGDMLDGGTGQYNLNGGVLNLGSAMTVDVRGSFFAGGGLIQGGTSLFPSGITVKSGGRFSVGAPTPLAGYLVLTQGSDIHLESTLAVSSGSLILHGGVVEGSGSIGVASGAMLQGAGQVNVPLTNVINHGTVAADGGALVIEAASLTTDGTLRANPGSTLLVQSSAPTNIGTIEADAGGTVSFKANMTNADGARIALAGARWPPRRSSTPRAA